MLKQGTKVRVQVPEKGVVEGKIVGLSTTGQPVIGCGYIIEAMDPEVFGETYPYTCFVAFEFMILQEEVQEQFE
jgi:hypothetical protein